MFYYVIIAVLIIILFFLVMLFKKENRGEKYVYAENSDKSVKALAEDMRAFEKVGAIPAVRRTLRKIKRAYKSVCARVRRGEEIYEFEKWLYENYNSVVVEVEASLYRTFATLPHCGRRVRIMTLCRALTAGSNCKIDADSFVESITLFNSVTPLRFDEVCALGAAIKLALLEKVGDVAEYSYSLTRMRERAYRDKEPDVSLGRYDGYLYYYRRSGKKLDDKYFYRHNDVSLDNLDMAFADTLVAETLTIKNTITSFKALSDKFDDGYVASLSPINAVMEQDEVYNLMDDASKLVYLRAVCKLGKILSAGESAITRTAMQLAREEGKHFGEYIFDGRYAIKARLHGIGVKKLKRPSHSADQYFFMTAVFVADALFVALAVLFVPGIWLRIVTGLLVAAAAFAPSEKLVIKIIDALIPARAVPRMDYGEIPDEGRVAVVVPLLLTSAQQAHAAAAKLGAMRRVNGAHNITYCLLVDLKKASSPIDDGDEEISEALEEDARLYGISYVIRRREEGKNGVYAARERKRGAVNAFNAALISRDFAAFETVSGGIDTPQFVILLDDDNDLCPGAVRQAVNTALHPLNQMYDLLTFTGEYKLSSLTTGYSARFLQSAGVEGYGTHSGFFFNLCGRSIYCGKCIYRLERFNSKVASALPDGRVLSHDVIEGALCVSGEVGITTYEDAPSSFASDVARKNRWGRGDILLGGFANKKYCSEPIYSYIIASNIIKFLAPIFALALWLLLLCTHALWLLFAALLVSFGEVLPDVGGELFSIGGDIKTSHIIFECLNKFIYAALDLLMLPFIALNNLGIALLTLWRLCFAKDNLLDWNTFFASQRQNGLNKHLKLILPSCIFMVVLSAALWLNYGVMVFTLLHIIVACGLYLCSFAVATEVNLGYEDKLYLSDVAKRTYKFFTDAAEHGALVSDNYQVFPPRGYAVGTSPTNLGFALTSHICAYKMGFITREECTQKLTTALDAIAKLEKWHGHLYNWYDTQSSAAMEPRFVSGVDSGNFLACLYVVRGYCTSHEAQLRETVESLINETDVSALYDSEEKRFYIGYNSAADEYQGHYDMLASESRLTSYIGACRMGDSACWNSLSRAQVSVGGSNVLLSWSGTAFEYLMPSIFLPDVPRSLLGAGVATAVKVMRRGSCNGYWGISESGYYAFDDDRNYKYAAFGLTPLSMRSQPDKCVVAPYASALSLEYSGRVGVKNLRKLTRLGALAREGFYESIDFSDGKKVVYEHMAHHQGMILCTLCNALCDGAVRELFMSNPEMRGGELLLEERRNYAKTKGAGKTDFVYHSGEANMFVRECSGGSATALAVFASGRTSLAVDNDGCGFSAAFGKYINRFRSSASLNNGAFIYVKEGDRLYCPTYAPMRENPDDYKAVITPVSAEFENYKNPCSLKVFMPAGTDCEIRRLRLQNTSAAQKEYTLAYYERLSMSSYGEDVSHPSFNDIFISTHFEEERNTLFAVKKSRERREAFYCALTCLGAKLQPVGNVADFIGRNGTEAAPNVLSEDWSPTYPSTGDVLNPCLGALAHITVAPKSTADIYFIKTADEQSDKLDAKIERIRQAGFCEYAEESINAYGGTTMKRYLYSSGVSEAASNLGIAALYRPYEEKTLKAVYASALAPYPFGLSRDIKYFVYRYVGDDAEFRQNVFAAAYLNMTGVKLNLVVTYEESDAYGKSETERLMHVVGDESIMKSGGIKLVAVNLSRHEDLEKLDAYAFCIGIPTDVRAVCLPEICDGDDALFNSVDAPAFAIPSGNGGFGDDGAYYVTSRPKLCYSNVVCMPNGGFVATENGGGFTYFGNSYENKLTFWSNDAIIDPPSESLFVAGADGAFRVNKLTRGGYVRYGRGTCTYVSRIGDLECRADKRVVLDGAAIVWALKVRNRGRKAAVLRAVFDIVPSLDFCRDFGVYYNERREGGGLRIVNALTCREMFITCDRAANPIVDDASLTAALKGEAVTGVRGNEIKHGCFCNFSVAPSEDSVVYFTLSCDAAASEGMDAREAERRIALSEQYFDNLAPVKIKSDLPKLDVLVNDWLMYQVVSSRLNGRCGFYQAGGAVGFRDQLQDCLAMCYLDEGFVRNHLLECAEHQYLDGDVMHWWHKPRFGVRTRISDDRLFLPYVASEYIRRTGDVSVLDERAAYLEGEPLAGNEDARLEYGRLSEGTEPLMGHLKRAVDSVLRYGEHGLLLIDGGDWNDALNDIGLRGRGESVWLSMFATEVLNRFIKLLEPDVRAPYIDARDALTKAVSKCLRDGYYMRAFTDDGVWLGSADSKSCKIDALTQSWAVIADLGDEKSRSEAVNKAYDKLVDKEHGIAALLAPPFDFDDYRGYISAYPRGIRENGGQYTHAAVWLLKACAMLGDKDKTLELLRILNPVEKCSDTAGNDAYKGEPYVLAGDVYANVDNPGRMGWSWYTGSAAWLYDTVVGDILGLKIVKGRLRLSPPLIDEFANAQVEYRYKNCVCRIDYIPSQKQKTVLNGCEYGTSGDITLPDEGLVEVEYHYLTRP